MVTVIIVVVLVTSVLTIAEAAARRWRGRGDHRASRRAIVAGWCVAVVAAAAALVQGSVLGFGFVVAAAVAGSVSSAMLLQSLIGRLRVRRVLSDCGVDEAATLRLRRWCGDPDVVVSLVPNRQVPGLWRYDGRCWILVRRSLWMRLDGEARDALLCHESTHHRLGDGRRRPLHWLVQIVGWWHPLVRRQVVTTRLDEEILCDREAHRTMKASPKQYARTIVRIVESMGIGSADDPGRGATHGSTPDNGFAVLLRWLNACWAESGWSLADDLCARLEALARPEPTRAASPAGQATALAGMCVLPTATLAVSPGDVCPETSPLKPSIDRVTVRTPLVAPVIATSRPAKPVGVERPGGFDSGGLSLLIPDGPCRGRLIGGIDGSLRLFDTTRRQVRTLVGRQTGGVTVMVLDRSNASPGESLGGASGDGAVRVWVGDDVGTVVRWNLIEGHSESAWFDHDGRPVRSITVETDDPRTRLRVGFGDPVRGDVVLWGDDLAPIRTTSSNLPDPE